MREQSSSMRRGVVSAIVPLLVLAISSAQAHMPHPDLIEKWREEGTLEAHLAPLKRFTATEAARPYEKPGFIKKRLEQGGIATGVQRTETVRLLVALVEFDDNLLADGSAEGTPAAFDSILFSVPSEPVSNPSGSMADFYLENSYGSLFIQGDIYGPIQMGFPYSYYVTYPSGQGAAGMDGGGRELARDVLDVLRTMVPDPGLYDSDGGNAIDGYIIIHAGRGSEESGDVLHHIWSQMGVLSGEYLGAYSVDAYNIDPEEAASTLTPIGVFCHEFGHTLGLPDLYDIDYMPAESNGIGEWSVMASGSYNGFSRRPASFDAWCKTELGFVTPIDVGDLGNLHQAAIPPAETDPVVCLLRNDITGPDEYWLVENRQSLGLFDPYLPGHGLCIWHIDEGASFNNNDPNRYHVAMEQADGRLDLEHTLNNYGDAGDPWPGNTEHRDFHEFTTPNSRSNPATGHQVTQIGVWSISDCGSLVYADLDVEYSRPWPQLVFEDSIVFNDSAPGGDGDGILEAGETIAFYCRTRNLMRKAYNTVVSLQCSNPIVTFTQNDVPLAGVYDELDITNTTPIEFTLASSFVPTIDTVWLTIMSDSLPTPGRGSYTWTHPVEVELGPPQVLVVDDDGGQTYGQHYTNALYGLRVPHRTWDKEVQPTILTEDLLPYPMTFWHTGKEGSGTIDAADMAAMAAYIEAGGCMLLSSPSGIGDIDALDPDFLPAYFGADPVGTAFVPAFVGVSGNPVGDGTQYILESAWGATPFSTLAEAGGGQAGLTLYAAGDVCGVTYSGAHNAVLLSFPVEFLRDNYGAYNSKADLLDRVYEFLRQPPTGCCVIRGDINHNGSEIIDIADLAMLVNYMFKDGPALLCLEEANVDGSDEMPTVIDITDLVCLVNYMFKGGPEPVPCP